MSQNSCCRRLLPHPTLWICPLQTNPSTARWCCSSAEWGIDTAGSCTMALFGFPFLEIMPLEAKVGTLQCCTTPALSSVIPFQWANIWFWQRLCAPLKPSSGNQFSCLWLFSLLCFSLFDSIVLRKFDLPIFVSCLMLDLFGLPLHSWPDYFMYNRNSQVIL